MIQDARFHSPRVALDSLADEREMMAHAGGQPSIISASFAGKSSTARILGMQPDKFHLHGVSVAQHGAVSMNRVELQIWLPREFGLYVSVQVLSNPNTTF